MGARTKSSIREAGSRLARGASTICGSCVGMVFAKSYPHRIREGKEAQEKLRRELRELEEDVSLHGLFLILAR